MELLLGLGAMVVVGLTWVAYGIIMGSAPKKGVDVDRLLVLAAILEIVVSLAIGCCALPGFNRVTLLVALCLFTCGIYNNRQLALLSMAMQRGPNGLIWSICQCGFVFPFAMGVLFFKVPAPFFWRGFGLLAIVVSLFLMGMKPAERGQQYGAWRLLAFLSFLVTGISQCLSNLPSYYPEAEAVNSVWRTVFFGIGMAAGSPLFALFSHKEKKESASGSWSKTLCDGKLWGYALLMLGVNTGGSYFLLYPGMDLLAKAGQGAIAYPVMVGSCILGFEVYAMLVLHEKRTLAQILAALLCLVGVATICTE